MPLTFRNFILTEALAPKDFDQLQREAQMFMKNIRRIKNGDELRTVIIAYMKWQKYLENFIYVRLLGISDEQLRRDGLELNRKTYRAKVKRMELEPLAQFKLREKVLVMSDAALDALSVGFHGYTRDPHTRWDSVYSQFQMERDKRYALFSRCVRDLFKALDTYRDSRFGKDGTFPEHYVEEYVDVEGFKVKLIYTEYHSTTVNQVLNTVPRWKADTPDAVSRSLQVVRQGIQALKSKGFGFALGNRLNFELLPSSQGDQFAIDVMPGMRLGTAGLYFSHQQKIQLFYSGIHNSQMVVHEIGHHVFRTVMNEKQRQAWTDFVTRNQITFTSDELLDLKVGFGRAIGQANVNDVRVDFYQRMAGFVRQESEVTYQKFLHFINAHKTNTSVRTVDGRSRLGYFGAASPVDDKQNDHAWELLRTQATKPFMLSAPTAYSNSNPEEAFCESFSYYVTNRPLDRIVTATLLSVCRPTV